MQKVNDNSMSNECEHSAQAQQVNTNCMKTIGVLEKGIFRIIANNNDFTNDEQTQEERKTLNEETIRDVKEKEVMSATDTHCEEEFMAVMWTIDDDYETVLEEHGAWSKK